jgi:hypothetical protein
MANQDDKTAFESFSEQTRSSTGRRFRDLLVTRWPEYVVEIVVVIIGITISFGIANFQERSANNRMARIYLQDLSEDLKSDMQILRKTISKTDSVIRSGQMLLDQNNTGEISLSKEDLVNLVRILVQRPNFISKNATFSSLKTTANFQLIEDIQLKNLLFEYDQDYQTIKAMEAAELQATVMLTGPLVIRSIPLTDSRHAHWLERLDVNAILSDIEFMNNVSLRVGNRSELRESYADLLTTAQQIVESIEKNL